MLIEAIDIAYVCSLQKSPNFSILADECQDISTQETSYACIFLEACSIEQLMKNEGPEIDAVEFEEGLEICKEYNHKILLWLCSLVR